MLAASNDFDVLVKEGNRIVYCGSRRPEKSNVQDSDFSEVRVSPMGGEPGPTRDTNGRTWVERYQVTVCTGDSRVDVRLYPVRWAIFRAVSNYVATLTALTWLEERFILKAELTAGTVGTSEIDLKRGIDGWAAVLTLEVLMWFSHDNLKGT
jgi:hypothetical protein